MKTLSKNNSPARKRTPGVAGEWEQPGSGFDQAKYVLRLYVSGSTSKSVVAIKNIKRICEQHLKNRYDLEVIDIYQQPNLAREEQIVAVPAIIKRFPPPPRRLIGDLSNIQKVLVGLDVFQANSRIRKPAASDHDFSTAPGNTDSARTAAHRGSPA